MIRRCRLRLEQWAPLLALARVIDLKQTQKRSCSVGLVNDNSESRSTQALARGWVSLEVLRAMLINCDAVACLAMLQELPELLEALPVEGYTELLQKVRKST